MKRRICPENGLGGGDKSLLTNNGPKPPQKVATLAIASFFTETLGCDYEWGKGFLKLGVEPTYQGDDLIVVAIYERKNLSHITTGRAFGHYGTGVRKKTRWYADYKYRSKFVKFIDEAHKILFGNKETK